MPFSLPVKTPLEARVRLARDSVIVPSSELVKSAGERAAAVEVARAAIPDRGVVARLGIHQRVDAPRAGQIRLREGDTRSLFDEGRSMEKFSLRSCITPEVRAPDLILGARHGADAQVGTAHRE